MIRSLSNRSRRTYFNNPLVAESLQHIPAALDHQTSQAFKQYLVAHLHHNSVNTRTKAAEYIAGRFAQDGAMNLDLARAVRKFGDGPIGREIFCFEYLRAIPLLQEIAIRWLAELPQEGSDRCTLVTYLQQRLGGRSAEKVAGCTLQALKQLGKATSPKLKWYLPVWSAPPLEAFLYVLAKLCPDRTMVRVESFVGEPILRAMLWPAASIPDLLQAAEQAGHVSKTSELDQYRQFTLASSGEERLGLLLSDQQARTSPPPKKPAAPGKSSSKGKRTTPPGKVNQLELL